MYSIELKNESMTFLKNNYLYQNKLIWKRNYDKILKDILKTRIFKFILVMFENFIIIYIFGKNNFQFMFLFLRIENVSVTRNFELNHYRI